MGDVLATPYRLTLTLRTRILVREHSNNKVIQNQEMSRETVFAAPLPIPPSPIKETLA